MSNEIGLSYSEKMMYFSFYFECAEYWVELGTISENSVQNIGHYKQYMHLKKIVVK